VGGHFDSRVFKERGGLYDWGQSPEVLAESGGRGDAGCHSPAVAYEAVLGPCGGLSTYLRRLPTGRVCAHRCVCVG
jgi:hypothetical protein